MTNKKLSKTKDVLKTPRKFSADEIYHMVMLHSYHHKSCGEIAKQFNATQGEVYEIIAKRTNSGCCG